MIGIPQAFAASYAQARAQFVGAAAVAGLALQPQVHPLCGPNGETLALDVVRDGPLDAPRLLIVSSGCHGVEACAAAACRCSRCRMASGAPRHGRSVWPCSTCMRSTRTASPTCAA